MAILSDLILFIFNVSNDTTILTRLYLGNELLTIIKFTNFMRKGISLACFCFTFLIYQGVKNYIIHIFFLFFEEINMHFAIYSLIYNETIIFYISTGIIF